MPYIKKEKREKFQEILPEVISLFLLDVENGKDILKRNANPGELNYFLSSLIWRLWKSDTSYANGNNLMGVLECVKQEFYRRQLAPYEDLKEKENGTI